MDNLFLIRCNEDGEVFVTQTNVACLAQYAPSGQFIDDVTKWPDPMYWGQRVLIIRGEVVVPSIRARVTEYSID